MGALVRCPVGSAGTALADGALLSSEIDNGHPPYGKAVVTFSLLAAGEIGAFAGMLGEGLVVHAPRADIGRHRPIHKDGDMRFRR